MTATFAAKRPCVNTCANACPDFCQDAHAGRLDVEHVGRTADLAQLLGSGVIAATIHQQPGRPARLVLAVVDTEREEEETEVEIGLQEAAQLAHGLLTLVQSAN